MNKKRAAVGAAFLFALVALLPSVATARPSTLPAAVRVLKLSYRAHDGRMRRAYGQRALVDLALLVGFFHTTCAVLNAFEIPAPS